MSRWDRIANALRAYQKSQQETWGDLDDFALARYLEGISTDAERQSVEQAMARHPAVGELVHVVRNVLAAPVADPERCWKRAGGTILELVDHLAAWVDEAGRTAAAGLQDAFWQPQLAISATMGPGEDEVAEARWEIPLPGQGARLSLSLRPGAAQGQWILQLQLMPPRDFPAPSEARLEVRASDGRPTVSGRLVDHLGEPIHLSGGQWEATVQFGEQTFRIPLRTGER